MKWMMGRVVAGLLLVPARAFLSTSGRRLGPAALERRTMMVLAASDSDSALESLKVAQLKEMVMEREGITS